MYKQQIINAIKNQQMLRISFRKETNGDWITRNVAPYDVFPQENKKRETIEDLLFGYAESDYEKNAHVVSIYISNIQSVNDLGKNFDGSQIRRLLKVKKTPYVTRDW